MKKTKIRLGAFMASALLAGACGDDGPVDLNNQAPVAVADSANTTMGNAVNVAVLSNDVDPDAGSSLSIEGASEPLHGTVEIAGDEVIYTPEAGFAGTDSFSYTVTDGSAFASGLVTIGVSDTSNRAPAALDDSAATEEDTAVSIDVLGNDSDPNGDVLALENVTQPQHGTASIEGGEVLYTPSAEYAGIDSFAYVIDDGNGGVDTAVVFVSVGSVDDAPLAADDQAATLQGIPVAIDVLANDTDIEGDTLSMAMLGTASGGTVEIDGLRVIYRPGGVFSGADSFMYSVTDGTTTAMATVAVRVNALDTDNDGLSDYEEETVHGTNPSAADSDGDGVPDYYELDQGTDPTDALDTPAGASVNVSVIDTGFETGSLSPDWTRSGDTGITTSYKNSGTYGLNLGGGGGIVSLANAVDTSQCTGIDWSYAVKRGPETPDGNENLELEYMSSLGSWMRIHRVLGASTTDPGFTTYAGTLSAADAQHAGFLVRLRHTGGSGTSFDDYFVDDVSVGCQEFAEPSDLDGDGLGDVFEGTIGTDPNLADTDGDGVSDSEERDLYGSNPLVADFEDEVEPNSTPDACQDITGKSTIVADLAYSLDFYCITANAGETLTFDIEAMELGSPLDAELRLFVLEGLQGLATNSAACDSGGYCADPVITHTFAQAGTYVLGVYTGGSPMPGVDGDTYLLRIERQNIDSDGDGILDSEEVGLYGTDPGSQDTDGDGVDDLTEIANRMQPTIEDSDGDGLKDGEELFIYGTDALSEDTDTDGLNDRDEILVHSTLPTNADTDGDGIDDGEEVTNGTNPLDPGDPAP